MGSLVQVQPGEQKKGRESRPFAFPHETAPQVEDRHRGVAGHLSEHHHPVPPVRGATIGPASHGADACAHADPGALAGLRAIAADAQAIGRVAAPLRVLRPHRR